MENRKKLDENLDNTIDFLLKENKDIVNYLKAVAISSRLKILTILLSSSQNFQNLIQASDLQKTTLSNHLKVLQDVNLIIKIHHGIYKITNDGKNLLLSLKTIFENSEPYKSKTNKEKDPYSAVISFLERNKSKE